MAKKVHFTVEKRIEILDGLIEIVKKNIEQHKQNGETDDANYAAGLLVGYEYALKCMKNDF